MSEPLTDLHASRLTAASRSVGASHAFAVITEVEREAFRFELTAEGLHNMHAEALLRPFLFWSDGLEFAVLDQANYFLVVAGPSEVVSIAVGGSVAAGSRAFEEEVAAMRYPPKTRAWLNETGRRYLETWALESTEE